MIKELTLRYSGKSWKNLIHMMGSQALVLSIGLTSTMLWTHYVSKETYGQYQLVYALIGMVAALGFNGLLESVTLSSAKGLDGNLAPIVRLKMGTDLIGVAVLLGAAWYYNDRPFLRTGLIIAAVLYPFLFLQNIWSLWLSAKKQLRRLAILQVLEPLFSLLVLGGLIYTKQSGLLILLSAIMLETVLFNGIVLRQIFAARANAQKDTSILKFGMHMSWIGWIGTLGAFDKLIIDHYLSPSAVATYGIVMFFPSQMKLLFITFTRLLSQGIYGASSLTDVWCYLKPKFIPIQLVFLVAGIAGFFLFPILIPILFSEAYRDAVPYARWLWLWWGFTGPLGFMGISLLAQRKTKIMFFHTVGFPVLLCTLCLLTIPRFGLWGAVCSNMITSTLFSGYHFFALRYYLKKEKHHSATLPL